jgi:hypothetical protein
LRLPQSEGYCGAEACRSVRKTEVTTDLKSIYGGVLAIEGERRIGPEVKVDCGALLEAVGYARIRGEFEL